VMEIVGRDVLKADNVNEHDAADIVCDEECKPVIATLHVRRHRCPTSLAENTSVGCLADSRRTSQTLIRCSAAAAGSIAAISARARPRTAPALLSDSGSGGERRHGPSYL
jgi:hypothetical protein